MNPASKKDGSIMIPFTTRPLLAAVLLTGAVAGCGNGFQPFTVTNFASIATGAGGVCTVSGTSIGNGVVNSTVTGAAGYFVGVSIRSDARPNTTTDRPNGMDAVFTGLKLNYTVRTGATFTKPKDTVHDVSILLATGGVVTATLPMIPPSAWADAQMDGKSGTVVVEFQLTGHTQDGLAIQTTPITFPVTLCDGSTAGCPTPIECPAPQTRKGCFGNAAIGQTEGAYCE